MCFLDRTEPSLTIVLLVLLVLLIFSLRLLPRIMIWTIDVLRGSVTVTDRALMLTGRMYEVLMVILCHAGADLATKPIIIILLPLVPLIIAVVGMFHIMIAYVRVPVMCRVAASTLVCMTEPSSDSHRSITVETMVISLPMVCGRSSA